MKNQCKSCGQIKGQSHICPLDNPIKSLGKFAQKGNIPWNKGKVGVYSTYTLEKMSKTAKYIGKGTWFKGKPKSEQHKEKLSILAKKRLMENSSNWRGGISKDYHTYNAKRRTLRINAEGSYTSEEWHLLKEKYQFTCPSCFRKEPEIKLTPDHIIPLVKSGSNFIKNIQPLCRNCNSKKHTKETKFSFNFI